MATNPALTLQSWSRAEREAVVLVPYVLGAVLLAGQAVVHVQQYVSLFHEVRWIGPLFIADAVASFVVIVALTIHRWRRLAALAGIVIAVLALGGLVVSYGHGLFGWQETGFRTPVELAVISEIGAVVFLAIALAVSDVSALHRVRTLP
jgi:hypothetical protein